MTTTTDAVETIIRQREERADIKRLALEKRLHELTEQIGRGSDWCVNNEGHPDHARQKERLDKLWEQNGKLYELMHQFRFPFRVCIVEFLDGITYDESASIEVVSKLDDEYLEALLPYDVIFFLAESEGLL